MSAEQRNWLSAFCYGAAVGVLVGAALMGWPL